MNGVFCKAWNNYLLKKPGHLSPGTRKERHKAASGLRADAGIGHRPSEGLCFKDYAWNSDVAAV